MKTLPLKVTMLVKILKLLKSIKVLYLIQPVTRFCAEFPSAVNAVECGVDFQNEIRKEISQISRCKLEFRLGINMGDVKKDNNLIGDEVNIVKQIGSTRSTHWCYYIKKRL